MKKKTNRLSCRGGESTDVTYGVRVEGDSQYRDWEHCGHISSRHVKRDRYRDTHNRQGLRELDDFSFIFLSCDKDDPVG